MYAPIWSKQRIIAFGLFWLVRLLFGGGSKFPFGVGLFDFSQPCSSPPGVPPGVLGLVHGAPTPAKAHRESRRVPPLCRVSLECPHWRREAYKPPAEWPKPQRILGAFSERPAKHPCSSTPREACKSPAESHCSAQHQRTRGESVKIACPKTDHKK